MDHKGSNLRRLGDDLLREAAGRPAQRAAHTLPHPADGLRQTVLALVGGQQLAEHDSPGPASLLVLRGRVRLLAGEESLELGEQDICPLPDRPHSVDAEEDSVLLLTVARRA